MMLALYAIAIAIVLSDSPNACNIWLLKSQRYQRGSCSMHGAVQSPNFMPVGGVFPKLLRLYQSGKTLELSFCYRISPHLPILYLKINAFGPAALLHYWLLSSQGWNSPKSRSFLVRPCSQAVSPGPSLVEGDAHFACQLDSWVFTTDVGTAS